jgi:hypothetical protein
MWLKEYREKKAYKAKRIATRAKVIALRELERHETPEERKARIFNNRSKGQQARRDLEVKEWDEKNDV